MAPEKVPFLSPDDVDAWLPLLADPELEVLEPEVLELEVPLDPVLPEFVLPAAALPAVEALEPELPEEGAVPLDAVPFVAEFVTPMTFEASIV